jgi:hypothetical protein
MRDPSKTPIIVPVLAPRPIRRARTNVDGSGFIFRQPLLPYTFVQSALGITVGADVMVPIGSRVRFTIPVRLTRLPQDISGYRTSINLRAGLGLSVPLWRHVN